ncbi:DUF4145 domain-containing protein [Novosphingobium sp. YJ-S2-02]|uniref:DUF4145 domain-containing protein n=2 Tax=Novosphingobium aureum TaxID=2792964 RepID=A0A931HC10_9SPHN|nr:DUF4145 domain-containing protein [Novosphingobium aureum]
MQAVGCSNSECDRITVEAWLNQNYGYPSYGLVSHGLIGSKISIQPRSNVKYQPDYIPAPIREDYIEACLIRNDSPKAAATLVRRCLQGMIRDFTGITKSRLIDEIGALRSSLDDGKAPDGVTHDSLEAIDAVRGIGNIGAHMEKDINLIVDVDPDEAQALIELVEMLFEEWYIARHKRQMRLAGIAAMAASKKNDLAEQKLAAAASTAAPEEGAS